MVEVNCFVSPEVQKYIDEHAPDDTPINIIHNGSGDIIVIPLFVFVITPILILYKMLVPNDS